MASYQKINGHWEVIASSRESETIDSGIESEAKNLIADKLSIEKLKTFVKEDSPSDFILKLFIPRYLNDGSKVSPDVIADIMAKISEAIGGASTWAGKGYWIADNILYEDKNIYAEVLLHGMSPERASLLSKYLASVIAGSLKQEGALTIIVPALSEFFSKDDYQNNEIESLQNIEDLNKAQNSQTEE